MKRPVAVWTYDSKVFQNESSGCRSAQKRERRDGTRRTSTQAFATLLSLTELIEAVTKGEQFKVVEPEFLDPETATWQDVIAIWQDVLKSVKEYGEWQRENEASE